MISTDINHDHNARTCGRIHVQNKCKILDARHCSLEIAIASFWVSCLSPSGGAWYSRSIYLCIPLYRLFLCQKCGIFTAYGWIHLLPAAASRLNMTTQTSRLRRDALFWVSCLARPNSEETAGRRHYTLL